jgi:transcription elongation factor GreA
MSEKEYMSSQKHAELLQELEELQNVKRKEITEKIQFARSLGDLSENAEYHDAREEQAKTEDRISLIENLLKNAEVIDHHSADSVEVGVTVHLKKETGETKVFEIVGSEEADMLLGKISYTSPLGQTLLGHKKGDTVVVETPKGSVEYKITKLV